MLRKDGEQCLRRAIQHSINGFQLRRLKWWNKRTGSLPRWTQNTRQLKLRRTLFLQRQIRFRGGISLKTSHILRRNMPRLIPKSQPRARFPNRIVRRRNRLRIYEVKTNPAPAYPVRLPTILALAQCLVAFQMALATGQATSSNSFRFWNPSTTLLLTDFCHRCSRCADCRACRRRGLAIVVRSRSAVAGFGHQGHGCSQIWL